VLIVDETGDRKRDRGLPFAAQQYIGKVGFTANGVVSVTSHWTDGTRHIPLGVTPYWPASRLPEGKKDSHFRTKPEYAWELIEEAWRSGIPFRAVVANCIYGEHPTLTANLFCADISYVVRVPSGCHSNHGACQFVEGPANPPAFNPREAAERVPLEQWQRVVRQDSHGKELIHHVVELELGNAYGPRRNWRLIAATTDPRILKKDDTWYLLTTLPLQEASPREVDETYCLRDWIEQYYKPVKHERGWADSQTRDAAAIIRHWHLVMLAFTFSLLTEAPPAGWVREAEQDHAAGKKSLVVLTMLPQYHDDCSDRETEARVRFDLRWKHALGLELDDTGFDATVLCVFRRKLLTAGLDRLLFKRLVTAAQDAGLLTKNAQQLIDSSHILGAAGVRDTYTLLRGGIRKLLRALG
jgi:DDE superfamily endonuclease/Transposase domain (DUF772)